MDEQSVGPIPSIPESTPKADLPKRQDVLRALDSSMYAFMKSVEPLHKKDPESLSDKDKRSLADYEIARNGWVKASGTPDMLVQLAWESEGKQYSSQEGTPIEGALDFLQSKIESLTEERNGADTVRQQEIDKEIKEYKKNFKILEASSRSYDEARNEQGVEVNDDLRHARTAFEAKVGSEDPLRRSNNPDDKQRTDEDWRRAEDALKRRRELFVPAKESKVKEEKKSDVEEERKEEPVSHKYPYFEDLETGESLEGIEKKLIRTKTIRDASGQVRTVEINFLQEVDKLLQQARTSDPSFKNQSDMQLLEILENRVRFPGDFKDPNVKDAIYDMTKIIPDQEVLLMAIEAKRAFLFQEDNKQILAEQTKAEGEQLHRREVRTGVRHDTIIAEIDGTLDAYFGKEGVKEIPQDDLTAFGFVADALLDVRDGSLGNGADGQAKTYRETFKELLSDAKTNPESNRKLLELRRYFYRNAIDALRSRELPVSEAKTPQEQVQMEMRTLIQTLQYQISQGTSIEELRKQYKGVLSGASERSVNKIDELLRKYPAVMIDMALKGGDLMERRSRYEGPKLHDVAKEIKHKRLVQGPTLEEAAEGKGLPPKKIPPAPFAGEGEKPREELGKKPPPAPPGEQPETPGEELPPAPPGKGKKQGEEPPPAPVVPPEPKETKPETKPLPTEATIAIAAGKQRIEHEDAQKEKVEGMEVMEEKAREMARLQMTEDRKKWEGKLSWLKQLPARFWKFTFGDTATYGKEKSHSLKLLAEAGLQVTAIRHDILQDIDALARERVKANRSNVVKRIAGKVRDVVHELTFTERDLHSERLKIVRELRMAAEDPTNNQVIIQELQKANRLDLLTNFTGLLTGDLQAAEGVARRINTEFGSELIHGLVGETMEAGLTFAGPQGQAVEKFLKEKVMFPILQAGIATGVVPDQVYLQVNRQMQDYFMSSEFIAWRDSLPPAVRDKFQETLSTVSDIAGFTKEYLLPQIRQTAAHERSAVDLENYVNNLVLKVNIGTLEAAQKGIIEEGRLERFASRSITNKRVHELYEQRRNSLNPSPQLVPQGYMDAAVGRAQAIRGLATLGVSNVTLGLATGVGLYATRATLGVGGRLVLPIVGGSVVGGGFRAVQERRLFTREWEQHGVERELNYQFPQDAKRRNEMQRLELHTRQMQSELADPMNAVTDKVKNGTATDEEVINLMGLIADTEARMEFADVRGEKGLFRATEPQSYQVEKTNLEVAKAKAKASLQAILSADPARVTALQNQLGINVPAGQNAVDVVLKELTRSQIENLQNGTQATAQQQLALGNLTVAQAQSVDARERAFYRTRRRRMAGAFVTTVAAGVGSAALTEVVSATIHPAILAPPAGSLVAIDNHLKLDLPKGFNVTNVDNVHHVINVTDSKGNAFVLNYVDGPTGGHVTGIVGPHGTVNLAEHRVGIDRIVSKVVGPEKPILIPAGTTARELLGVKFNLPSSYQIGLTGGGKGVDIFDGKAHHLFDVKIDPTGKVQLIPKDPNDTLIPHFFEKTGVSSGPVTGDQIEQVWKDSGLERTPAGVKFWTNETNFSDYQELQLYNSVFQNQGTGHFGVVLDGGGMQKTIEGLNPDGTPHFVEVNDLVAQSPLQKMQFTFQLGGHGGIHLKVDANFGNLKFVLDPDRDNPIKDLVYRDGQPILWNGINGTEPPHNLTIGEFSRMVLNQDKIGENVANLGLNPGANPDKAVSYATEYLQNFKPGTNAAEAFKLGVDGKHGNISAVFTDANNKVNYLANITARGSAGVDVTPTKEMGFDFGTRGITEKVTEIPINQVDMTGLEATDIYIPILIPLARRPLEVPEGQFEPIPPLIPPGTPPIHPFRPYYQQILPPEYSGEKQPKDTVENYIKWLKNVGYYPEEIPYVKNADGNWVNKDGSPIVRDVNKERKNIERYLQKQTAEHTSLIENFANQMSPMENECRVAVTIPAYLEGKNIYRTLTKWANQTDDKGKLIDRNLYEIDIIINGPTGYASDNTVDEIEKFKEDHPDMRINVIQIEIPQKGGNVGMARKILTDTVLLRSIKRANQSASLYLASEDADLMEIDKLTLFRTIQKYDEKPYLDALRGKQDLSPKILMNNDYLFFDRRVERMLEYLLRDYRLRPEVNENFDFYWNRIITGGWNTSFTADAYTLIGGYQPAPVGEDVDIGRRISVMRGETNEAGRFIPNTYTTETVPNRGQSNPRRFIHALIKRMPAYADFTNEEINREIRQMPLDEMMNKLEFGRLITPDNVQSFEEILTNARAFLLWKVEDSELRYKLFTRLMTSLGFSMYKLIKNPDGSVTKINGLLKQEGPDKKEWNQDYHIEPDGKVKIDSIDNVRNALGQYRQGKKWTIEQAASQVVAPPKETPSTN